MNGIFENLFTKTIPAIHQQMFVVTKLRLPKGKHNVTFTLMQEDKVLAKSSIEKDSNEALSSHTHFWNISGLKLETWSPIELQILVGGKQVFIKEMPVVKVKQKQ